MGMPQEVRMGVNATCFTDPPEEIDNGSIGHGLPNIAAPQIDKDEVAVDLAELLKEVSGVEGHKRWWNGNAVGLPRFGSCSIAVVVPRHNANEIVPGVNILMAKSE